MRDGIHTIRGKLESGELKSLLQDGRKGVGWEIMQFDCWTVSGTNAGGDDAQVVLLTNNPTQLDFTNADAYNQIAWSTASNGGTESIVEPNRVVIEDLSICSVTTSEIPINFMLILKQVKTSPIRRIVELVRQRGQGALI